MSHKRAKAARAYAKDCLELAGPGMKAIELADTNLRVNGFSERERKRAIYLACQELDKRESATKNGSSSADKSEGLGNPAPSSDVLLDGFNLSP